MTTKIFKKSNTSSRSWKLWGALPLGLAILLAGVGNSIPAFASGSASFSLSPTSGSHKIGSTFSVALYENGSDVGGFNANLSYSSSLLQCESVSAGSSFSIPGGQTCGGGSVSVGAASTSAKNGSVLAATMTFKVLAKGTAAVRLTSGSGAGVTQILDYNTSANIWNGGLPNASFSLTSSTTTTKKTPAPTKHASSGLTSTTQALSSHTPAKIPTSKTSTSTKNPATGPSPAKHSVATTPSAPAANASLSVNVTDANGKAINHAKVTVDSLYSEYTDSSGKAGFSSLSTGAHKIAITAAGEKTTQESVTLSANQTKLVTAKLDSSSSASWLVYAVIAVLIVGAGAYLYFKLFRKRTNSFTGTDGLPPPPVTIG